MASDRVFHPQHEPDQRSAAVPAIAEKPDLNRLCQQDAEDPEVCSSLSPQNYTLISISLLRYKMNVFFFKTFVWKYLWSSTVIQPYFCLK